MLPKDVVIGSANCEGWVLLEAAGAGVLGGLALIVLVVGAMGRVRELARRRALRLAEREDGNGRALLQLADDLEAHAAELERHGLPCRTPRTWARLCRRVASDHLASINYLMVHAARPDRQGE